MRGRMLWSVLGVAIGMILMLAALWTWGRAGSLSLAATRPEVARWALRSAAVGTAAIAQLILLTLVAGAASRQRNASSSLLPALAGIVACVALVSAAALGLAGR